MYSKKNIGIREVGQKFLLHNNKPSTLTFSRRFTRKGTLRKAYMSMIANIRRAKGLEADIPAPKLNHIRHKSGLQQAYENSLENIRKSKRTLPMTSRDISDSMTKAPGLRRVFAIKNQ